MKVCAIIAAAGSGRRMNAGENKVFLPLLGKEAIKRTVDEIKKSKYVSGIIIVTGKDDMEKMKKLFPDICVIEGGRERQDSVYNGLKAMEGYDLAAIHDGARALITAELFDKVIEEAMEYGAAACGIPEKDSLKKYENGFITETVKRDGIIKIQTPQVFSYKKILYAYENCSFAATDDCEVYERVYGKIRLVLGSNDNIKLTTPEDIIIAEQILKKRGI